MVSARVGEGEGDLEEPDTLGVVALEVVEALEVVGAPEVVLLVPLGVVDLEVVPLGVVALEVVAMEEVVLGVAIWGLGPLVFLVPGGASKR